jgi:tRNA A37 threonylcarbamoyladenosine modification protein TsaB
MKIYLKIEEKNITLILKKNEVVLDEKKWVDDNNLLEKFFPAIEKLLAEHNLKIQEVEDFQLETNLPKGYTTERIARTIIQTLNFGK